MGGTYQSDDLAGLLDAAMGANNRRREQKAAEKLEEQAEDYREQEQERQEEHQASEQGRLTQRNRASHRAEAGASNLAMSGSLLLGNAASTARDRAAESATYEQQDQPAKVKTEKAVPSKGKSLLARGAATYGNRRIS